MNQPIPEINRPPKHEPLVQTPEQRQWTQEQRQLSSFIHGFAKDLATAQNVAEGQVGYLPEHIFVGYFLPYFVGDSRVQVENGGVGEEKVLKDWYSVSGGPLLPVVIIDNQRAELFTVPAIATTNFVDPNRQEGSLTFREIVTMAGQYTMISPIAGDNFSSDQMAAKFMDIYRKDTTIGEREQQWIKIFHRYKDIIPKDLNPLGDKAPVAQANPNQLNESDTDF